jgi:hypothetical protein
MELRELTTPTTSAGAELAGVAAESIRIARLPPVGEPDQAREPAAAPEPAPLRFATEPPRGARLDLRTALCVLATMFSVFVIVIASSSGAARHRRAHPPVVKLSRAQERVDAARRARAAAIAKARRDRGTDAELQDTIPAATPSP